VPFKALNARFPLEVFQKRQVESDGIPWGSKLAVSGNGDSDLSDFTMQKRMAV